MRRSYSIRAVAEETGLSTHTIRAWERRYGVLNPDRTVTNRRVYGEEDVRRLRLLQRAIASGHSIGMVAGLSVDELSHLTLADAVTTDAPSTHDDTVAGLLRVAEHALKALDASMLETALTKGTMLLGIDAVIEGVIVPLIAQVGKKWEIGDLGIAQEHMASAIIRSHLERTRLSMPVSPSAPRLIATTPAGQQHELGAMLVAVIAARLDWDVTYLGPNLPAKEIADSAKRLRASAVALSLVYPYDDPALHQELRSIRSLLPPGVEVFVGGGAATSYAPTLQEIGARTGHDLSALRQALQDVRNAARG